MVGKIFTYKYVWNVYKNSFPVSIKKIIFFVRKQNYHDHFILSQHKKYMNIESSLLIEVAYWMIGGDFKQARFTRNQQPHNKYV